MEKIDWNKAMSELEDAKNYIEDYVIECATRLVEEQEEAIFKTIQHIGGNVFIDITVDKNKVIEALTDYQKKVKGKSKSDVKEVIHAKWEWFDAWEGDDTFGDWKMLRCSHCLESEGARENARFCSNCGAIMDLT